MVDEYSTIGLAPRGPVHCLSLRYRIAQKIHACTDPLDGINVNDRARDLVDLQLLSLVVDDSHLAPIRAARIEIFTRRRRHPWPPTVRVRPAWPTISAAAARSLGDDIIRDVEPAATWLHALIGAIDVYTP